MLRDPAFSGKLKDLLEGRMGTDAPAPASNMRSRESGRGESGR